jgi:hypothetical protein
MHLLNPLTKQSSAVNPDTNAGFRINNLEQQLGEIK